jgi:hypothetical protein
MILMMFASAALLGGARTAYADSVPDLEEHTSIQPALSTQSAYGCNGSVCIRLVGTGTNVERWRTTVSFSYQRCTRATYLVNDGVFFVGRNICGVRWDVGVSEIQPGNVFRDGDVLCNTWSGFSGKPCKRIIA